MMRNYLICTIFGACEHAKKVGQMCVSQDMEATQMSINRGICEIYIYIYIYTYTLEYYLVVKKMK